MLMVGVVIGTGYLSAWVVVVANVVQEWKGVGTVEVHKVYEIFLPKDAYAVREAYR